MKKMFLFYISIILLFSTGCAAVPAPGSATAHSSATDPIYAPDSGSALDSGSVSASAPAASDSALSSAAAAGSDSALSSAAAAASGSALSSAAAAASDSIPSSALIPGHAPVSEITKPAQTELAVHFIDVGQGDSTLILCDGEAMLIDAGNNDKGTTVQLYLTKQNVSSLKYVIGTHPDADHIGGLDVILYKFDCETVIMPDKTSDSDISATYRDVLDTMEQRGYKNTLPIVGDTYSLGSASFTILGPSEEYGDTNNCSVAILLKHRENSFLFTGDAESEEEKDIVESGLDIDADVYKAGHHGSSSSSSPALLNAVTPEYAVISCGEGNSYGHPHAETLNHLRSMGVQVFRTDEQGSILVTSDGSSLTWDCSPSETWLAGESTLNGQQQNNQIPNSPNITDTQAITSILNTNTKKFHYPDCASVAQMKEKNKRESTASRDEIIGWGYEPCKNCNP